MLPEELRAILGRNVRAYAQARGMTLTALADFAEVSRSQLFVLLGETGGGTLAMVAKLANVLKVEPWQLLHPDAPQTVRPRPRARRRSPR